jgi:mannose-6-phosphate isomerase-like protein (cupin superfamily)
MASDEYKTIWTSKSRHVRKRWGRESYIGSLNTITAKILYLMEGQSTSLKYYKQKNEVLFIRKGRVAVEYDSEKYHWQDSNERRFKNKILGEGEILYVQSCCPYRITAVEDSEIIEIGDSSADRSVKIEEE